MTELEAYKAVVGACSTLTLNMNDQFAWACADTEDLDSDDVEKLIPLVQKYGVRETLLAYASIKRGQDSSHQKLLTPRYYAVKAELNELAQCGTILWEQWSDREDYKKDLAELGSTIKWTSFWSAKRRKLLMSDAPGNDGNCQMHVTTLDNGTFAVGRCQADARTRLVEKVRFRKGLPRREINLSWPGIKSPEYLAKKFAPREEEQVPSPSPLSRFIGWFR